LKETKVNNHKAGGILIQSTAKNLVKISHSKIVFNDIVGIHFVGEDASASLEEYFIIGSLTPKAQE
jgi:hypothetical protein